MTQDQQICIQRHNGSRLSQLATHHDMPVLAVMKICVRNRAAPPLDYYLTADDEHCLVEKIAIDCSAAGPVL